MRNAIAEASPWIRLGEVAGTPLTKGADPSVYVLLYMLYSCQNILPLVQKPVALQRRLGLLG